MKRIPITTIVAVVLMTLASQSAGQNRPMNGPDTSSRSQCDGRNQSRECAQNGALVREIQTGLQRHCRGLPANFVDGVWGDYTQQTLVRFQRAYGLVPDGVYGPASAQALAGSQNGRC